MQRTPYHNAPQLRRVGPTHSQGLCTRVTIGQQIWFELRIPRSVRAMGLAPNDYFHGGAKNVTHAVPQYSATKRSWGFALEALREKVVALGRFQGILLKFHILKTIFLHEKIIFFGLDFFPDKVWL